VNNKLVLVDTHGKAVGVADKLTAHQDGLLHLAFSLMVYRVVDEKTECLIQKRAASKYHAANLWSNTCCSHPYPNERPSAAVQRRIGEELGIRQTLALTELQPILYRAEMSNGLIEHEFDHVFISNDELLQFEPNADEVSEVQWLELRELRHQIEQAPSRFTPWLPLVLERLIPNL